MNGKSFESQLLKASIELERSVANDEDFDPQTGFSEEAIVHFIVWLPELDNKEQIEEAKAVLRKNGKSKNADNSLLFPQSFGLATFSMPFAGTQLSGDGAQQMNSGSA